MTADLASIFRWKPDLCRHGYSSGHVDVALSELRVSIDVVSGKAEKRLNAAFRYLSDVFVQALYCSAIQIDLQGISLFDDERALRRKFRVKWTHKTNIKWSCL